MKRSFLLTFFIFVFLQDFVENACRIDGVDYNVGKIMFQNPCLKVECLRLDPDGPNRWYTDNVVDELCDQCRAQDDPHFETFDVFHENPSSLKIFDFHGFCRYSLVERINWAEGRSPSPNYAVYAHYSLCGPANQTYPPSCQFQTSFQLSSDPTDIIHVFNADLFTIYNNDGSGFKTVTKKQPRAVTINDRNYKIFVWKFQQTLNGETHDYLRMLGKKLLVQVSQWGVRIWTRDTELGMLGGLCGKYDHNPDNDQTTSANEELAFVSNPSAFPNSWFAPVQLTDFFPFCASPPENLTLTAGTSCPDDTLSAQQATCQSYLSQNCGAGPNTLVQFTGMCARDLCYYPDNQQYWMDIALEVCRGEVQLFPNRN